MRTYQPGYTLIEMLIVMAVIGVLIGVVSLAISQLADHAAEVGAEAELETIQRAVVASMVSNQLVQIEPAECIEDLGTTDLDLWPLHVKDRYPGGGRSYTWDVLGNVTICEDSIPRIEASYWDNRTFSGQPVVERIEQEINHDWGYGSPDPLVPTNRFSARWAWSIRISDPGTYQFTTMTDDGTRVYLDGTLITDHWVYQRATEHVALVELSSGSHDLVMEYFEGNGNAVAILDWIYVEP